jgi:hypothetical protein
MSDFGGTPLAVGTVTGHRAWNVDHLGRLRGITHPAVWLPGENVAACKGHRGSSMYFGWGVETPEKREPCTDEQIPVDSCGCGFWAYHAGGDRPKPSDERAIGIVEGYGRTIIGTKGFRSQKARIVAVVLPTKADPRG